MRRLSLLTAGALFSTALAAFAAVTPQGWWHYGELTDYYQDSSGNARRFNEAFSSGTGGGGNAQAGNMPFGAGGPLGTTAFLSTNCLYWTPAHLTAAGMWAAGNANIDPGRNGDGVATWNPPPTNYVIECWCLPEWPGTRPGNRAWLFCSGSSGGVCFQLTNDGVGTLTITARIVASGGQQDGTIVIGDPWVVDTNRWTHLAIVNDNSNLTFYVNGVAHGAPDIGHATAPAGDIFGGSHPGTQPTYAGYLDELRISTFAPGQFSTNDLMTRSMAPNIISQPQSASVWNGGAAPFAVGVAFDNSTTYQWRRGTTNLGTTSELYLNTVGTGDNLAQFTCVLNNYTGIAKTSSVATLTVVNPNLSNVNAYHNTIANEPGLVAYYPGDTDTGTTLTDIKGSNPGTLEGTAAWDGRTNRSFGARALRLPNTGDGDVTIPNNPDFAFPNGNGTIEALVYLDQALSTVNETIFAQADDGGAAYYQLQTSSGGTSLIYSDSSPQTLTWAVPVALLGRLAHVALVFTNNTATAYVDGQSLGEKAHTTFGSAIGAPAWIGSAGLYSAGKLSGTVDELAVYTNALSAATIQSHYGKFVYGTNTIAPFIVSQSASKTLLAGGKPQLAVAVGGTPPFTYQWKSNGVSIAGATAPVLNVVSSAAGVTAAYSLAITNNFGFTTANITLNFTAPPSSHAAAVMADHPMGYFRLDETSGSTAFDSAGMNDATYSGAMTRGVAGVDPSDAAVNFTGGNAQAPWSSTLNNPAGPFSAEFWIKPSDTGLWVPLASQNRNNARAGYCFYQNNGGANIAVDLGLVGNTGVYRYTGPGPTVGQWMHVVFTSDGTTINLYTDGALRATDTGFVWGTDIMANSVNPFIIGDRNGGGLSYKGVIDDVVVYDYPLTPTQVSNHWSVIWTPAAMVTQPPASLTTNEWATVTIPASASGIPNSYQWQTNGVDLVAFNNPDGTPHYPNGVNSPTLVISQAHPADNGSYRLVVLNPVGGTNSINSALTIAPDTTKPTVTAVKVLGTPNTLGGPTPFLVRLDFSERVDSLTGTMAANYTLNGGVTVNSVQLSPDSTRAYLTTTGLNPGQKYALSVSNVTDQAETPNTILGVTKSTWAPLLAPGMLWDFYPNVANGVGNLLGNAYYPNAPYTNLGTGTFDSTPITTGDLNNNPAFGALGDNYGCSLSGWITPTVTTNYYFFLASDDASELYLSSDASPVNAISIAVESGCCHGFQEPGNPTTSPPQALVAGNSYFIRALQTEGGGGDYVKVAWKMEGDSTYATNLVPIGSSVLTAFTPLAQPKFTATTYSGGKVTVSWTGLGTLLQSADLKTWAPVPGNPTSPYQFTPTEPKKFFRVEQ